MVASEELDVRILVYLSRVPPERSIWYKGLCMGGLFGNVATGKRRESPGETGG